jgi:hypothetical protein
MGEDPAATRSEFDQQLVATLEQLRAEFQHAVSSARHGPCMESRSGAWWLGVPHHARGRVP